MPFSHLNQDWEFTSSEPVPCFSGIRSKRGLEFDDSVTVPTTGSQHYTGSNQQLLMQSSAKRVCLRDSSNEQSSFNNQLNSLLSSDGMLPSLVEDSLPHRSPQTLSPSSLSPSSLSPSSSSSVQSSSALSFSSSSNSTTNINSCPILPSMVDGYHNSYNNHNNNNIFKLSMGCRSINDGNNDGSMNNGNVNRACHSNVSTTGSREMECVEHEESIAHQNQNHQYHCPPSVDGCVTNSCHLISHGSNGGGGGGGGGSVENKDIDHNFNQTDSAVAMETTECNGPSLNASASLSSSQMLSNRVFCGFSSCRGMRPSPVSGRSYCHCFRSWRGMYGLEGAYHNDYY